MDIEIIGAMPDDIEGLSKWESDQDVTRPLKDSLAELGSELQKRGWIITTQTLDEELLTPERYSELKEVSIQAFQLLQVGITKLDSFLEVTFQECVGSVSKLKELQGQIAKEAEEGQQGENMESLRNFSEGLRIVLKAFHDGVSLLHQADQVTEDVVAQVGVRLSQIEKTIEDVIVGIRNQDPILLADAFTCEFPDQLDWLEAQFDFWQKRLVTN